MEFPQGGIETGETPEAALAREVFEEISLPRESYSIVSMRGPYRYRFPSGMTKKGFRGQTHHYFLLRLRRSKNLINVATANCEFRQMCWIRANEFDLNWLPPMKRRVYRHVLRDFFGAAV